MPEAPSGTVRTLGGCAGDTIDLRLVAAVRDQLPPDVASTQLADLFRMLGDANRMRILLALAAAGELCVCDLAAVVGSSESSVSHALRLLRTAGMVRSRRAGRRIFYCLDDAHVRMLLDLSTQHVAHLHPRSASASSVSAQE